MIRQAAAVDREVAALQSDRARQRLAGYSEAARELIERHALRPAMTPEDGAALIWTLGNPETYRFLVTELGWPTERYRTWIEAQLRAGLLGATPP